MPTWSSENLQTNVGAESLFQGFPSLTDETQQYISNKSASRRRGLGLKYFESRVTLSLVIRPSQRCSSDSCAVQITLHSKRLKVYSSTSWLLNLYRGVVAILETKLLDLRE